MIYALLIRDLVNLVVEEIIIIDHSNLVLYKLVWKGKFKEVINILYLRLGLLLKIVSHSIASNLYV